MNIVSIRDTVKKMRKDRVFSEEAFNRLIYAPVFLYERDNCAMTDDEAAWCEEHIIDGEHDRIIPTKLPYQHFLIWHPATKERSATLFCVLSGPQTATLGGVKTACILTVTSHDIYNGQECVMVCSYTGAKKEGVITTLFRDGKNLPAKMFEHRQEEWRKELKFMAANTLSITTRFCYDVMSQTNAVIKVTPQEAGRSVEWQLARTHFCILSKKQAMSARDRKKGITPHDLKRAAGWRRAHFRLLRASCFTNKRGQKVPVREAWVGPEEWVGLDDKLYKVML